MAPSAPPLTGWLGVIKYLGSKRTLIPTISAIVAELPGVATAADPFTGTTRVAQALKQLGIHVTAGDITAYAATFARCYIKADATTLDVARITDLVEQLGRVAPAEGYVTQTFCREARFFHERNGARIDAMRAAIDDLAADDVEHAILLTSLIEAADRVDSTTGVQMAYLKQWAPRASNDIALRVPELVSGTGAAVQSDAAALLHSLGHVDLVYLDPPYNQHSYLGNYHAWETITRADEPEAYGVARKRIDVRERRSAFNSTRGARDAFAEVIDAADATWMLVSFNAEGFLPRADIEALLAERWPHVGVLDIDHPRYVGARIGIHSPSGEKVGSVSHVRTTEHVFLAGPDEVVIERALGAGQSARDAAARARLRRS